MQICHDYGCSVVDIPPNKPVLIVFATDQVEKAIHYGLPLWPEAVHMARSYHRAKKDLAGGKYYIIGSEFTETEFDSPYSYRELGRYPEDWEKRNKYQKAIEELEKLEFSKDSSGVNAHGDASSLFRSLSKSLKDASARACFENDKSKHIALLLGGVSAGELEILQSERNSLDICQISDDAVSECEVEDGSCRSDHDLLRCQRQDLSQILIHDKVDEFEEKTERKELCSERETAYDIDRGPNKPCQGRNEESMDHGSANASNLKQQSTTVKRNVKNFTLKRLDFSAYEEKLHRMCEENYLRPCSPVRSFARILPKEEWIYHYAMSRNEKNAPTTAQRDTSMSATSEEEDVKHSSEKVEGIKQAIASEDNSEESEELCADSIPKVLDGSVSVEEKPKRSFVYPFDDTSSIVGSDYSDDAIGTDIFMEISEHRREEGASSPSACSDNSKVALPPNVFVWLPQTCDIELLTRFRAPSPNAIFEVVLPSPSTAFLDLSFTAVKSVDVSFSWVFDLEAGGGATLVLPSKSRRRTSCYDKVCIRKRKRKSPLSSAKRWKRSDSMKECLMLLETGSMPSQIIDVTPCLVEGAAVKMVR
uniref:Mitotic checkpoint serine/threonine-protein kinase BUB1 n=1 Tax=Angiostrongylus cantonensis TaxID=6313 RepID=A0A0K0DQB3_ANGCA